VLLLYRCVNLQEFDSRFSALQCCKSSPERIDPSGICFHLRKSPKKFLTTIYLSGHRALWFYLVSFFKHQELNRNVWMPGMVPVFLSKKYPISPWGSPSLLHATDWIWVPNSRFQLNSRKLFENSKRIAVMNEKLFMHSWLFQWKLYQIPTV